MKNLQNLNAFFLHFNTVIDRKKVVRLFRKETTEIIHIQAGEEQIDATPTHPFWVEGYGFKAAGELVCGDYVETADGGLLCVTGVERENLEKPITVYNFEVEDWHTYYVSGEEILVHNMCALGKKSVKTNFVVSSNGIAEAIENGQHVLEKHVGLSDYQLMKRLKNNANIAGASTFTDDMIADTVVHSALTDSKNIARINIWLSKGAKGNLPILYKGNTVIGRGILRDSNKVIDMTNARVILKSNGKGGYDILTAYPNK